MTKRVFYSAIFAGVFGILVWHGIDAGLTAPPEDGDAADYDAIAFNIWQRWGYGYDWDGPERRRFDWSAPESQNVLDPQFSFYPTTYRPPAMPYLLALVYALTHRSLAAWRIVNCAIMAGAITFAAAISRRLAGVLAAVITALLALQSPDLTFYSHMLVTEGVATFLLTLLAWAWLRNGQKGWTTARAAGSGLVFGVLMATRSIFVLWLPLTLVMPTTDDAASPKNRWRLKAVCILVSLIVIGPWWVRNMLVTDAFMPMGTQSAVNMPAGFGPRALRFEGMWAANPGDGADEVAAQRWDPVTAEVQLAKFRSALTLKWMRENPSDVLWLMYLHVWQETRPRGSLVDWLLPLAGVAGILFRKSPVVRVVALLVCANVCSIALTWSVGGRFMVPLQPLLIALIAAMMAAAARFLMNLDTRSGDAAQAGQ